MELKEEILTLRAELERILMYCALGVVEFSLPRGMNLSSCISSITKVKPGLESAAVCSMWRTSRFSMRDHSRFCS